MILRRCVAGPVLAVVAVTQAGAAETYPARPIRIVVPYAVGGATDIITRVVAQSLAVSLGVGVAVENRTGGGGTIATKAVSLADPDSHAADHDQRAVRDRPGDLQNPRLRSITMAREPITAGSTWSGRARRRPHPERGVHAHAIARRVALACAV